MQDLINEEMEKRQSKENWELLEPYSVPRDHVNLTHLIDEGAAGEVWRGQCRGKVVAVKRLKGNSVNEYVASRFRRECNLMAHLQKNGTSHANLVQMIFCCWDRELLMGLEYCENGSLQNILFQEKLGLHEYLLTWGHGLNKSGGVLAAWSKSIAAGMKFIHSADPIIIHRDLKPGNILLRGSKDSSPKSWIPIIADFGDSRQYCKGDNLSMVGSRFYACPEILLCEEYNETADVFSFGVVLYDIITWRDGGVRKALWGDKRYSVLNVVKGMRPRIPTNCEAWLSKLINLCWSNRADERPSFEYISKVFDEFILEDAITSRISAVVDSTEEGLITTGNAFSGLGRQFIPESFAGR